MSDKRESGRRRPPPRTDSSRETAARGEFDFIDRIRRRASEHAGPGGGHSSLITHHSSLLKGIGDDAALIRHAPGYDACVTADLLAEGVDFRLTTTTPRLLGHKALAVSLSDIAAMGARPRWALVTLGVPRRLWRAPFLREFYKGLFALADAHGVTLVGGDVSRTVAGGAPRRTRGRSSDGPLVIDSIVLGEVRRGRAVTRAGARPGDLVYVTGSLGGAAAGLRLLESGAPRVSSASSARGRVVLRQRRPEPRVGWGLALAAGRLASAMIDLSDGLSSDLAHLCAESGTGARIDASRVPVDADAVRALRLAPDDALRLALSGGEDFELLFTVSPRKAAKLPAHVGGVAATRVGVVTDEPGRILLVEGGRERALAASGFRHF